MVYCFLPFFVPAKAENVGTLYSMLGETPIVDGFIDSLEWQAAQPQSYTLYDINNQFETREVLLYSMYNASDFLFIAVEINETYLAYNEMMLFFQTNDVQPLIIDLDTWYGVNYSMGQDVKWLGSLNVSNDMYTEDLGITADENHFGINNLDANCTITSDKISWEMIFPLNSQDTIGHDVSLEVGDSINFFISFESDAEYLQFRNYDLNWDYGVLQIGLQSSSSTTTPLVNIPITFVLFGLFATSFVVILQKKKCET